MIEKYKPFESSQFKKGRKLAKKQGLDMIFYLVSTGTHAE